MSGKRFTIVLPVQNGGSHLRLCVESILAQRCGDFDLAILDNASTDGTTEWLSILQDPRVSLYPAERSLSIEENWARILQVPRGEFMTVIGHDDLLGEDYLEVMNALIDAHPDAGLYFAHFRLIDTDGHFLRHCRPMPARETAAEFLASRMMNLRDSFGTGYLMRTADYNRVGGIPPYDQLMHADDALWMLLVEGSWKATSPRELFSYRLHAQSTSGVSNPVVYLSALERYQDTLTTMAERDPAVREVLARYGPEAYFQQAEYLHKRVLLTALAGRNAYPKDVPARLHRLKNRFVDSNRQPHKRKKYLEALDLAHRVPGGRWLYRIARRLAAFFGQQARFVG